MTSDHGAGPGHEGRSGHRRLWSDRFVGRERSLERIALGLQGAADARPNSLIQSGTSGVGLSRLMAETERRIAALDEPFVTIRGVATPATSGVPYAPIGAALENLLLPVDDATLAELVGPTGDVIARLVPELRPRMQKLDLLPARLRVVATEWREARMFEAVLGLLERLGQKQPVVLVLEDMHHADAATRGLTTFLARVSRGQRVLMVLTYQSDQLLRTDPLRATLASLATTPSVVNAELAPLDRTELGQLIEAIEGSRPSSTTLLLVAERSHGNPLIAEEVLAARRELSGVSLAGAFERLVTARSALRSIECRRVLRLLSLAGGSVTWPMLLAMAAEFERSAPTRAPRSSSGPYRAETLDGDMIAGAVEGLEHGFLVETADGRPMPEGRERRIGFRHELIAEAIAADLLPATRRRYHAALAAASRPRVAATDSSARAAPESGAWTGNGLGAPHAGSQHPPRAGHHPRASTAPYSAATAQATARATELTSGTATPLPAATALSHYLAAHQLPEAEEAALAAAAGAEELDAGADALAHYETALGLYEIAGPPAGGPPLTDLYGRAAEAAFAAGDPSRASAYSEAAAALLDAPSERLGLGLVMEQLGRYRRASGDHDGALTSYRRAVDLIPAEPTAARARALASLAQFRMLEGVFSEARRLAQEAVDVAGAVGPAARQELLHATCTLAVAEAWGDKPEPAVEMLRRLLVEAAENGRLDDLFRVYANLTTVLDLLGRRDEAIAIAYQGIAEAEREGQATVYGNFLRANAAESLFFMGRWQEVRRLCLDALSWNPVGIWFLSPLHTLATVEVAVNAGEQAGRLLGQVLLAIETVQDPQFAVPAQQLAAAYALWQEDLVEARRAAERGWRKVIDTEDWLLMARMAATCLEVDAAVSAEAHRVRDLASLAAARERSLPVVLQAEAVVASCGVPESFGSRRQADLAVRTARAFRARIEGHDDPATWAGLAEAWVELGDPYEAARARWREAEALLDRSRGRSTRTTAREPLSAAAEGAYQLGAWPLLRSVSELARRAMLPLPKSVEAALELRRETPSGMLRSGEARPSGGGRPDQFPAGSAGSAYGAPGGGGADPLTWRGQSGVASGSGRPGWSAAFASQAGAQIQRDFGLSKRELEVLALIAEGRSNPEIGRELYITRKTVAVHVSNILTKLGVSGRVEAAAAAIRLGLTEHQ